LERGDDDDQNADVDESEDRHQDMHRSTHARIPAAHGDRGRSSWVGYKAGPLRWRSIVLFQRPRWLPSRVGAAREPFNDVLEDSGSRRGRRRQRLRVRPGPWGGRIEGRPGIEPATYSNSPSNAFRACRVVMAFDVELRSSRSPVTR